MERAVIASRVCAAGNGTRRNGVSHEFTRARIRVRAVSEHTVRSITGCDVQTDNCSLTIAEVNDRKIASDEIGAERFRRRIGRSKDVTVRKEAHIAARLSQCNLIRVGKVTCDRGSSEIESRIAAGRQM